MNKYLIISKEDNVAVALKDLKKGEVYENVTLLDDIVTAHKFALKDIKKGENIIKYGYPIGHAKEDIKAGSWVHSHNIETNLSGELEYKFNGEFKKEKGTHFVPSVKVYKRKFDKVGIRNNFAIVPLVGCINRECEQIAALIKDYVKNGEHNVDEVTVLTHPFGCSQLGGDLAFTINVLKSIVKHPNNGAVLIVSLGCENNQLDNFLKELGDDYDKTRVISFIAQKVSDEVEYGFEKAKELIDLMDHDVREVMPLSCINLGLKCGGSDGFSGISANPLVGEVSDYFVERGATTVLSEVPEMFGAETILMDRADSKESFDKTVNLINGFKKYYTDHHQVCYENPSPGNKAGGITTLEEKSLGCVQKSGHSEVKDVLYVGDTLKVKGLNLLNGPGNDLMACTNLASVGCHLILFTTGRGTPFGTYIPTLKISTNTSLSERKSNWIDFNAGQIVDGRPMDEVLDDFLKLILSIINGETKSKNEINGFEEISIFKDGVTL